MIAPDVTPGVKQRSDLPSLRIDSRKIGALVVVTVVARQRQVLQCVRAAMLFRNDVLDVKRQQRQELLEQSTVFATPPSPLADQLPSSRVPQGRIVPANIFRALDCRTARKSIAET